MKPLQKRSTDTLFCSLAALTIWGLAACSPTAPAAENPVMEKPMPVPASADIGKTMNAPLVDGKGKTIGDATFTEGAHGVIIRILLKPGALAPGWHGLHLHEIADCADAAAGFKASGKHVGHGEDVEHGFLAAKGPEPGDLPNLYVAPKAQNGGEFVSGTTALSTQKQGGRTPLLDADGSALIIHANPDDMKTQPVGGAGDRVACAAIKAPAP